MPDFRLSAGGKGRGNFFCSMQYGRDDGRIIKQQPTREIQDRRSKPEPRTLPAPTYGVEGIRLIKNCCYSPIHKCEVKFIKG